MGFCQPDGLCKLIKNPVNYSKKKDFFERKERGEFRKKRQPMTEEEKRIRRENMEKRRRYRESQP